MLTLGEKVRKIRSKNAGPFWITIDIFCGNKKIYKEVCNKLKNSEIINILMILVNYLNYLIYLIILIQIHFYQKLVVILEWKDLTIYYL